MSLFIKTMKIEANTRESRVIQLSEKSFIESESISENSNRFKTLFLTKLNNFF